MPDLLSVADRIVSPPLASKTIAPGAAVIGADGARLGMVSTLAPDAAAPTHLLVFVAERQQLIPREYPLPLASVIRVDDGGTVHVTATREGLRRVEESRRRGVEESG
jgi:hypothetical protein